MSSSITITGNTDSVSPKYTSRYPSGNRPTTTQPLELIGTPSHLGDVIVVSNGAYNFGTRTSAPEWFQVGDRAWGKNGEVIIPEASIANGNIITPSTSTTFNTGDWIYANRGSHIGLRGQFAYESLHQTGSYYLGQFNCIPLPSVGTPRTTGKANISCKIQHMATPAYVACAAFSNRTGTFIVSNQTTYAWGEDVSFRDSTNTEQARGKILKFSDDDTHVTFVYNSGTWGSTLAVNGYIVGLTSGASLRLPSDTSTSANYASYGAAKLIRGNTHNDDQTGNQIQFGTIVGGVGNIANCKNYTGIEVGADRDGPDWWWKNLNTNWHNYEFSFDFSSNSKIDFNVRRGTQSELWNPNCINGIDMTKIDQQYTPIFLGMDWAGGMYDRSIRGRLADPCLDWQNPTAFIGNNSVYANCTQLEKCRPNHDRDIQWSNRQAPLKLNYGDIPSGTQCYLFFRDDNLNIINSNNGLSIGVAP